MLCPIMLRHVQTILFYFSFHGKQNYSSCNIYHKMSCHVSHHTVLYLCSVISCFMSDNIKLLCHGMSCQDITGCPVKLCHDTYH